MEVVRDVSALSVVPTEQYAQLYGGWRNITPGAEDELRESYTSFMAALYAGHDEVVSRPRMGMWVCITPERWTACASYSEAVQMLQSSTGVGVVDQAFCQRHVDLCDEAKLGEMMDAANQTAAELADTNDEAETGTGIGSHTKPYIISTGLPPHLLRAFLQTTAEDHDIFLARYQTGLNEL